MIHGQSDPDTVSQSLSFLNQLLMIFLALVFFCKKEEWLLGPFFIKYSSLGGSGGPLYPQKEIRGKNNIKNNILEKNLCILFLKLLVN